MPVKKAVATLGAMSLVAALPSWPRSPPERGVTVLLELSKAP